MLWFDRLCALTSPLRGEVGWRSGSDVRRVGVIKRLRTFCGVATPIQLCLSSLAFAKAQHPSPLKGEGNKWAS